MFKIKTYWLGLVLLLSLLSFQSEGDETEKGVSKLKSCITRYLDIERFSMDVEYSMFTVGSGFNNPIEKGKGKMITQNGKVYQEELNTVTIANDKYLIKVNNKSKVISVAKNSKQGISSKYVQLDSMLNYIEMAREIDGGYEYYFKYGSIKKVDILFDSNGLIKTFRSYYRKQMNLGNGFVQVVSQIRYLNFNLKPVITEHTFSLSKYVQIKNGQIFLKADYKDYYILNNLK